VSQSQSFVLSYLGPEAGQVRQLEIQQVESVKLYPSCSTAPLGSFSNDDGDGNEDVRKAIGLLRKTTTLPVHHAFLYISLPSLHDYDVKMPNCKFCGGRKQATTNHFFSL